jgi:hypothetical protein
MHVFVFSMHCYGITRNECTILSVGIFCSGIDVRKHDGTGSAVHWISGLTIMPSYTLSAYIQCMVPILQLMETVMFNLICW